MYEWNNWSAFTVVFPVLLAFFMAQYYLIKQTKNPEVASPTLFQWLSLSGGSILAGHAAFNIINFIWCVSIANPGGGFVIALLLGIMLPLINGVAAMMAGLKGCCCKKSPRCNNVCQRLTMFWCGMAHIFGWHAGYVIGPISLIIASILPPKIADRTFGGPMEKSGFKESGVNSPSAQGNQFELEKKGEGSSNDEENLAQEKTADKR